MTCLFTVTCSCRNGVISLHIHKISYINITDSVYDRPRETMWQGCTSNSDDRIVNNDENRKWQSRCSIPILLIIWTTTTSTSIYFIQNKSNSQSPDRWTGQQGIWHSLTVARCKRTVKNKHNTKQIAHITLRYFPFSLKFKFVSGASHPNRIGLKHAVSFTDHWGGGCPTA